MLYTFISLLTHIPVEQLCTIIQTNSPENCIFGPAKTDAPSTWLEGDTNKAATEQLQRRPG